MRIILPIGLALVAVALCANAQSEPAPVDGVKTVKFRFPAGGKVEGGKPRPAGWNVPRPNANFPGIWHGDSPRPAGGHEKPIGPPSVPIVKRDVEVLPPAASSRPKKPKKGKRDVEVLPPAASSRPKKPKKGKRDIVDVEETPVPKGKRDVEVLPPAASSRPKKPKKGKRDTHAKMTGHWNAGPSGQPWTGGHSAEASGPVGPSGQPWAGVHGFKFSGPMGTAATRGFAHPNGQFHALGASGQRGPGAPLKSSEISGYRFKFSGPIGPTGPGVSGQPRFPGAGPHAPEASYHFQQSKRDVEVLPPAASSRPKKPKKGKRDTL